MKNFAEELKNIFFKNMDENFWTQCLFPNTAISCIYMYIVIPANQC